MRGLAGMVVAAAALLARVPTASAGTYDVVSCGAPGAGGVNARVAPELGGVRPVDGDPNDPPDPGSLRDRGPVPARSCWSARRPRPATHRSSPAATGSSTRLPARGSPASRRGGSASGCGPAPTIPDRQDGDQGDPGGSSPATTARSSSAASSARAAPRRPARSDARSAADRRRRAPPRAPSTPINVGKISLRRLLRRRSVPRLPDGGSPNTPIAMVKVFGTRVTVTDNVRPTLKVGGRAARGRLAPAERRVTYDASDSTGIRARRLEIGGTHAARRASVRLPPPRAVLERQPAARSACPPGVPDGTHSAARIVAEDAAGNETFAQRDDPGRRHPADGRARARTRQVDRACRVTDAASGVAGADARGPEQVDRAVPGARRQGRERAAHRQARPRPRLARRHARDGPRRGGQRRARRPDPPHGNEREVRPAQPQGALRPRQGALRPHREAPRAPDALREPGARGPDDRRDGDGPPPRRAPPSRPAAR